MDGWMDGVGARLLWRKSPHSTSMAHIVGDYDGDDGVGVRLL